MASGDLKQFPMLHDYDDDQPHKPKLSVPVLTRVPWNFVQPHELQAQKNHQQTLEHLAERGGLSESELLAVLEDREWSSMSREEATRKIHELLAVWLATYD